MKPVPLCLALLLAACTPPAPPCGPTNCNGCCDATGQCQGGSVTNACGQFGNACNSCGPGQTCSLGACVTQTTCRPTTCAALQKNCGQVSDGCGGTLACGTCAGAETCGGTGLANVCGPGTCMPATCMSAGADCGTLSDGCAAQLNCGGCPSGSFCNGANECGGCMPTTCAALQKNCGAVADGCGGMLSCGTCGGSDTCGGGGTQNVCGTGACVPTTCAAQQKNCGSVPDTCGNMLACGTCAGFATCGGSGTANVCGAACTSSCPTGFTCDAMGVCVGGSLTGLVLNEVGYTVSGTIQVNGAAPTYSVPTYCTTTGNQQDAVAQLRFIESSKGYNAVAYVRCNSSFGFSTLLPAGTYEVRLEASTYSANAGINLLPVSYQVNAALVVTGNTTVVLNEVGHAVSGTIQVNGAAPTYAVPTYCTTTGNTQDAIAQIRFIESRKGYDALAYVRCNSSFAFNTLLPPGTWEVRVESSTYSANSGINLLPVSYQANPALVIAAPVSGLVLNEVGHAVSGTIQVNGAAPTYAVPTYCTTTGNTQDAIAQLRFTDSTRGYNALAYVRCNANFGWSTLLPPGTYEVRLESSTYSANAGINLMPVSYQVNAGLTVSGPLTNQVMNEVGHAVSGTIQVNGAAPTYAVPTYCTTTGNTQDAIAQVRFREMTKGYDALASVRCNANFGFSTILPPGTWEVRVESSTYSANAGINLLPVSYQANPALVIAAPVSGLVLNELGHAISGTIQVNGAAPTYAVPTYCTTTGNTQDAIAQLRFTDSTRGYSAITYVRCNSNFGWSTLLPQGTYEVRLESSTYSANAGINLLPVSYQVNAALAVSGPSSNLVFNEVGRAISGTIQVNGAPPTFSVPTYCTTTGNTQDAIAQVRFLEASKGYNALAYVRCNSNFGFSTLLPPGAWELRLETSTYSANSGINLMPVSYQAITRLQVP